jgi:hypothetical protein
MLSPAQLLHHPVSSVSPFVSTLTIQFVKAVIAEIATLMPRIAISFDLATTSFTINNFFHN